MFDNFFLSIIFLASQKAKVEKADDVIETANVKPDASHIRHAIDGYQNLSNLLGAAL